MNGYRNYCFTSFENCDKDKMNIDDKNEKITYCVYQKEQCPTSKKLHWQGYVELKNQLTIKQLQKIFNDKKMHCEPRKGSQSQAIDYCKKSVTRIGEPIEIGSPKYQGQRSDLDSIYDCIENGDTSREILHEFRGTAMKHINHITRCQQVFWMQDKTDEHIIKMGQIMGIRDENGNRIPKSKKPLRSGR